VDSSSLLDSTTICAGIPRTDAGGCALDRSWNPAAAGAPGRSWHPTVAAPGCSWNPYAAGGNSAASHNLIKSVANLMMGIRK